MIFGQRSREAGGYHRRPLTPEQRLHLRWGCGYAWCVVCKTSLSPDAWSLRRHFGSKKHAVAVAAAETAIPRALP